MVSTRASQPLPGSQGSRKRRASSTFSETGSQASKARKTGHARRFATADEQLVEEQRSSLERSPGPVRDQIVINQQLNFTPTHSRQTSRHSLPANLSYPPNIKFEPLSVALARELQRRRRETVDVSLDGAVVEIEDHDVTTYIEPSDLGIDATQLMTPQKRAVVPIKHTPQPVSRKPSPISKREDDITNYEDALHKITSEKAEVVSQLQVLQLAVQSLGFGDAEMLGEDVCALVRTAFDDIHAQESELALDLPWEQMNNAELLKSQPDIIRGLLRDIDQYAQKLDEVENHLALTDAEYNGVLAKLAEREECNEAQKEALQLADNLSNVQKEKIISLLKTCGELTGTVEGLQQELEELKEEFNIQMQSAEEEKESRLALMAEELNQEHNFRMTAEAEINTKDAVYTKLQIKYEHVTSELDKTKDLLEEKILILDARVNEIAVLNEENDVLLAEKEDIERAYDSLEGKSLELEDNIKTLTTRLDQSENTVKEQNKTLASTHEHMKEKEQEVNQLRTDVFGGQEDIKRKAKVISKLETDVENLNNSMQALHEEMDNALEEKNIHLDELEDEIAGLKTESQQQTSDLEALRQENLRFRAANEELQKALSTRGKDVRILKDITNQLIADTEHDITTQQDWVSRKSTLVDGARKVVATISSESSGTMAVMHEVEKTKIVKSTTLRDSGYLGGEDEQEFDLLMATQD